MMKKIITVGETMAAFAPEKPGMIRYAKDFEWSAAGAESNLAIGVCKLGHKASWLSQLGEDEFGHFVLNTIRAEGVETEQVRFNEEYRTGVMFKQVLTGRETSVFYYRENSAASHMDESLWDESIFDGAEILHLTGITPVLSETCRKLCFSLAEKARNKGVLFSFDPNIRKKLWKGTDYSSVLRELLLQADIVLLGLDEAHELCGTENADEAVSYLFSNGAARYVAVKDGARGAYVADRMTRKEIPPYSCNCVDPIGAGDAFNAAFLCGILEGKTIEECGEMGAVCGALATETFGDTEGYPTMQMLDALLRKKEVIYR